MPALAETPTAYSFRRGKSLVPIFALALTFLLTACGGGGASNSGGGGGDGGGGGGKTTNPPPQPTDITPINGEVYYVLNQLSGFEADLISNSITPGDHVIQQSRSFTGLSQRWAFTSLSGGSWKISNLSNGFCLDTAASNGTTWVVENPCNGSASQQWTLTPTSNGYYAIASAAANMLLDAAGASAAGADLVATTSSGAPAPSQQWLLRPAFFRGVDNALLEKQELAHENNGVPWWNDAGQVQDVLEILKHHGVNMIRLRPSSAPPYTNPSGSACSGNLCYAETDAQDLDLAKRARNLGMSIQLTLLFDGGSSQSVPSAWTSDSLTQFESDLYTYVKQELMSYRQAGVMPDLVAIGNEVDTGFLGATGSPTSANFPNFAALEKQALQAVADAAADTSIGPALPPPLTCIHITPAWDLTNFFVLANQNGLTYDAICQSFYPMFHGPLTSAQASASNPGNKPIEQSVLNNAATNLAKPIIILETGEHYENGFDANDPWYTPPSQSLQRQFLLDLDNVVESIPNHLGMGIEYWDATGVNVPTSSGNYVNGDGKPDSIFSWNGLNLFDDADSSGKTNVSSANYSMLLPGIDALGSKLDSTLSYKFVNRSNGQILASSQGSNQPGAQINTAVDSGNPGLSQQWSITSNNDGYFLIASMNPGPGATVNALDDSGGSFSAGNPILLGLASTSHEQEWDVVSAGNGYFNFKNRLSGLVLDLNAAGFAVQQAQSNTAQTEQWQIVPVH
jgi:arabinogalactan endo-1,4-beta-galactosidase